MKIKNWVSPTLMFLALWGSAHAQLSQVEFRIDTKTITGASPFPCPPVTPSNPPWPNTQVEPCIAIGPNPIDSRYPMVAIAYQEDRYNSGGGASDDYMIISFDGGRTFGEPIPLPYVRCFGGPYDRSSDPGLAITSNGDIYFSSAALLRKKHLTIHTVVGKYDVRKNDWEYFKVLDAPDGDLAPLFANNDFPTIIADPQDECGKTLYVNWDFIIFRDEDFEQGTSILQMSKTTDGFNWSQPIDIYAFSPEVVAKFGGDVQAQLGSLCLLNNPGKPYSALLLTFLLGINPDIAPLPFVQGNIPYSTVSYDQGETWSNPIPLDNTMSNVNGQIVDPDNHGEVIRAGGGGTVVDRDRNVIYSLQQEHSIVYDGIPTQNVLYVSTDNAASWDKIGPLNTVLSTQSFNANISVLGQDMIAVSYFDYRNHHGNNLPGGPLETDRWMDIYSYDKENKSVTLLAEYRLTEQSFNNRNAPAVHAGSVIAPGLMLGDFMGQVFFERKIYNVYATVPIGSGPNSAHLQLSILEQFHPIPGNQ